MPLRVDTCVAQHIGDRREQQDRAAVFPHPHRSGTLLAVVADGMGGHSGGALAAEQVVLKARQCFEESGPGGDTGPELLSSIIQEAHLTIKLARFTSEQDPHSTATVLMLQPRRADWAHCGDSRVYHFRGERCLSRSPDHSLVGELTRQGKITEEQARAHPQRNLLIHCLGDERDPKIDFGHASPLHGDDVFVLCSDGLWGYFSDRELGQVVSSWTPREAAEILINTARDRAGGAGDNISVVIIRLTEEAARSEPTIPPSRFGETVRYQR